MIRKKLTVLCCAFVLLVNSVACGSADSSNETKERKTEKSVVATTEQALPEEPVTVEPTTEESYDIESELDRKIQAALYDVEHASDDVTLEWPTEVEASPSGVPSIFLEYHDNISQSLSGFTMFQSSYAILWMPENQMADFSGIKKAIDTFNSEFERGPKYFSDKELVEIFEKAEEKSDDKDSKYRGYSDIYTPSITRIDDQVLSVLVEYENTNSVANGYKAKEGYTYNAETGEKMLVSDVVSSVEELKAVAEEILSVDYADVIESEPGVEKAFDESFSDESELQWTLGPTYLSLYYNSDTSTYLKVGTLEVKVRYEDYPDLFDKEIGESSGDWVIRLTKQDSNNSDNVSYTLAEDIGGDEKLENISVSGNLSIDTGVDHFDQELYEMLGGSYLIKSGDKYLLYVICQGDNDYDAIWTFDVTGGNIKDMGFQNGEISAAIPQLDYDTVAEYYIRTSGLLYDPQSFYLKEPQRLLSSYSGSKHCKVADDGTIEALDNSYRVFCMSKLTSKQDLDLDIIDENGNVTSSDTIPSGTEFTFYKSDGETYVDFIIDGGRIVRVTIDTSDYPQKVNGLDDQEVFSGMIYAG